jgi:solute carrier family 25 iron transporter 28/37
VDGLVQAFRTVYQYQGMSGYFRGMSARVIYQMPSTAISWLVYEFFKYRISRSNHVVAATPQVHCAPPSQ